MTDELAAARLGRIVGKYRLERVIGSGGMATVYEATHRNGHRVALKMLKPSLAIADEVRSRFLREGYAANKVGHPGAVRILDDDVTSDGLVFLVMELLDGWTLEVLTREHGGRLDARIALQVAAQLLDVLRAAHESGIVHRDVKPENVFVQRDGVVKVLDFGVARVLEPKGAAVTATGRMLGTPAFMPPEQAYGRRAEVDAKSDLWSVGATLFAALTGRVVHEAATAEETLIKAATERAPSLASVLDGATPPLVELVDRALAHDKSARWSSAVEMRDALLRAYEALFSEPCPAAVVVDASSVRAAEAPLAAPQPLRRVWAGAAVLAASAIVLIGSVVFGRTRAQAVGAPASSFAETVAPAPSAVPVDLPPARTVTEAPIAASSAPPITTLVRKRGSATARALPSASASASSVTPSGVCGFEFDEEGRKWPRRCP